MCNSCGDKNHDDLNDDFSDLFGNVTSISADVDFAKAALARPVVDKNVPATFEEPCKKCRGTGRFVGYTGRIFGECFTCKGKGVQVFKTSTEDRQKAADAKGARHAAKILAWMDAHPAETEWLKAAAVRGFNFATDQLVALGKYADLNEARVDRIQKFMAQDLAREEAKAELAARPAQIVGAPMEKIENAFATAFGNSIQHPKLRLDTFIFSPAPLSGKNAGAIYVKHCEELDRNGEKRYLGKIVEGKFVRVWGCSEEEEQRVIAAAMDPAAAATAYGQRTGRCSICGRKLTKAESIERAIGPICLENYGW